MSRASTRPPTSARILMWAVASYLLWAAALLVSTVLRLADLRRTLERLVELAGPLNPVTERMMQALAGADQGSDGR